MNRLNRITRRLSVAFASFALLGPQWVAGIAFAGQPGWNESKWLTEMSVGAKESFDDNLLGVSGHGLPTHSSWVNAWSPKVGLNLLPMLPEQRTIQMFSFIYQPEVVSYSGASEENYTAHKINTTLKGKAGALTFSLDNSFLYNDGNKVAPTYALNQIAGAAANQNDKYRSNYANALPRERRNQDQDRYATQLQYNLGSFFVRPASALVFYDLHTYQANTGAAPFKGYQNYCDRYDLNSGVDLGYKFAPEAAVTVGYRTGYQYQERFAPTISSDQHYASNHYQRLLVGLEGKLAGWITVKVVAGSDFHDYNPNAPVGNLNVRRLYGDAVSTLIISPHQSVYLNFKQWLFLSSTGLAPYNDITYSLAYHFGATKNLGLDFGVKRQEADFRMGNDFLGSAPCQRDDIDYGTTGSANYTFSPQFSGSVTINFDLARNGAKDLAATYAPSYREFDHKVVALAAQYRF